MAQITRMTVKRPDGTIETVERPGHITDTATRHKFEQATAAAGRGDIIGWAIVGPVVRAAAGNRQGLWARETRRCRGCGRIGDDGECGLGDY